MTKHGHFAKPKNKKPNKNAAQKGAENQEAGSETHTARGIGRKTWDLENVSQTSQRLTYICDRPNGISYARGYISYAWRFVGGFDYEMKRMGRH